MKTIGLTGQTGAGKGSFCKILAEYGIPCLDTDKTAREVVEKGTLCLKELCLHFGDCILYPDGTLDRKKLGSIAFSDKDELSALNRITHKYITEKVKEWIISKRSEGCVAAVIDAPQLFESGEDKICDITVALLADYDIRFSRITRRDGISGDYARKRMASQLDEEFFIAKCDHIIRNNGTEEELREKTVEFLKKENLI